MKGTIDFYNAAKGDHSDYYMAKALGVSTAAVCNMKKRQHLSAYHAAKCAEMAGLDPAEAITIAAIEAEHEEEKRNWMLKKLGGIAAGVAVASVTFFATPADALASMKTGENVNNTLSIMSNHVAHQKPRKPCRPEPLDRPHPP